MTAVAPPPPPPAPPPAPAPAPTVRGRVATPGGARRAHLRELRRESLWFWPAVAAIAAWVGGDLAARDLHAFVFHQGLFPTNLDDARTLLATIAAALLTFTGVVFSITLVALQMASTQYSPRVLRTFVRKPVTKLALATFIATFVYSLTLLARVGTSGGAHTVPQGAVGLAYLLVMVSVIVFVFFVHSTVRSMRVTVRDRCRVPRDPPSVTNTFCDSATYVDAQAPPPDLAVTQRIAFNHADAVLDGLAAHHLVELAAAHGCVLRLTVPVGTFVHRGFEVIDVLGHALHPARPLRDPPGDEQLRRPHHLPGPQLRRAAAGGHRDPARSPPRSTTPRPPCSPSTGSTGCCARSPPGPTHRGTTSTPRGPCA